MKREEKSNAERPGRSSEDRRGDLAAAREIIRETLVTSRYVYLKKPVEVVARTSSRPLAGSTSAATSG